MKKLNTDRGLIFFLAILMPFNLYSQSDNPYLKADTGSKDSRSAFYAAAGHGSNMIYLGSTMSKNLPYQYGSLIYGLNSELYLSASAIHLSGSDPFIAYSGFSITYSHNFNSWLDISAGLYRYQFSKGFADTLFSSFNYADASLGIDWRLLYTKISAGKILNESDQKFLQVKNSHFFQTPSFFRKKANISFDPYVNLLFGTLYEETITTGTTVVTSTQQYTPWSPGTNAGKNSTSGNGQGPGTGSTTTSTTTNPYKIGRASCRGRV